MTSKTAVLGHVKAFAWAEVDAALTASPDLLGVRDERGRGWLHICCATPPKGREADSLRTAEVLVRHGLSVDAEAWREGDWLATPVWFTVSRGENLDLTAWLLERGANPDYSLWAAAYRDDIAAIDLLVRHGAKVDDAAVTDTPFLWAAQTSHLPAAEALLRHGADVNAIDDKGRTALHCLLKKDAEKAWYPVLIAHGARGDIPDREGRTAAAIMRRKRDPDFKRWAEELALG